MFDTQKNESTNTAIAYGVPKNKTIPQIVILNSRIYCVVGIYVSGFNKYWQIVFNLMELKTSPIFKQLLQARTKIPEKSILSTI